MQICCFHVKKSAGDEVVQFLIQRLQSVHFNFCKAFYASLNLFDVVLHINIVYRKTHINCDIKERENSKNEIAFSHIFNCSSFKCTGNEVEYRIDDKHFSHIFPHNNMNNSGQTLYKVQSTNNFFIYFLKRCTKFTKVTPNADRQHFHVFKFKE